MQINLQEHMITVLIVILAGVDNFGSLKWPINVRMSLLELFGIVLID